MTKAKTAITQALLREWLHYEPDTGVFTWIKIAPRSSKKVGDVAGSKTKQRTGHRHMLWLLGQRIYAGRAAFIYVNGDIPAEALVDHADGNTLNDRLANLRLASTVQNSWNRLSPEKSQLLRGVSRGKRGRYKARIQTTAGQRINLGTWASEAEAHAAYMGAAAMLHSEFWIANRPVRKAS